LTHPPVRILIARHGETEWNLLRRFQGHRDSPLTTRGQDQADRLAARLQREPIRAVYVSDLGRAINTAAPIASTHGLNLQTSPELREIDCGAWTGRAKEELAIADPEGIERYRVAPASHTMPSGECLADVQSRGWKFLQGIRAEHLGETIVVITHHIVVETLIARAMRVSLEQLWLSIPTGNCYLSALELTESELNPLMIYDGSHLAEAAQPYFEAERVA
jgi:broad specificity phosphatase PhoE